MELKLATSPAYSQPDTRSNRTFMELKFGFNRNNNIK